MSERTLPRDRLLSQIGDLRLFRASVAVGPIEIAARKVVDVQVRVPQAFAHVDRCELEPGTNVAFAVHGLVVRPTELGPDRTGNVQFSTAPYGRVTIRVENRVNVSAVFRCVLGGWERHPSSEPEIWDGVKACKSCGDMYFEPDELPDRAPNGTWHHPLCDTLFGPGRLVGIAIARNRPI